MQCKNCSACHYIPNINKHECWGVKEPFRIDDINMKCSEYDEEYWNGVEKSKVNTKKEIVNYVRFFAKGREEVLKEYENIHIPYIGSTVYIYEEPYLVNDVTYDFDDGQDGFNLIDIHIEAIVRSV